MVASGGHPLPTQTCLHWLPASIRIATGTRCPPSACGQSGGHPSPIRRPPLTHQVRGLWSVPRYRGLDEGEFAEGHELDCKWKVAKEMIGQRLSQAEAKRVIRIPAAGRAAPGRYMR